MKKDQNLTELVEPPLNENFFRVMTYNVHSCVGLDKKTSPERIAEVISQYEPDVVCLQELDVNQTRTQLDDQPHLIAKYLQMDYHFHPSFEIEEGHYGNAILSRYPIELIKSGILPNISKRERTKLKKRTAIQSLTEPRGAIWVEVEVGDLKVQLVTTHLSLQKKERKLQFDSLLSEDWLENIPSKSPTIFCGDLNTFPCSSLLKPFLRKYQEVQEISSHHKPKKTFLSWFPFVRLDYIFINDQLEVKKVMVPQNKKFKIASDHFPLIADLLFR